MPQFFQENTNDGIFDDSGVDVRRYVRPARLEPQPQMELHAVCFYVSCDHWHWGVVGNRGDLKEQTDESAIRTANLGTKCIWNSLLRHDRSYACDRHGTTTDTRGTAKVNR